MEPPSTLSIFVSASVVALSQTLEQATLVAGHIGRAAAVFRCDEVIVVDEETRRGQNVVSKDAAVLARLLQYQETPQYLRKQLIPVHKDFRFVGALPPLDAPHHQRSTEWSPFREGVVLSHHNTSSLIDIGLEKNALVEKRIRLGARVTLEVGPQPTIIQGPDGEVYSAQVIPFCRCRSRQSSIKLCSSMRDPLRKGREYWGFTVRIAQGLSAVFLECPFSDGYDLVIGTSERGNYIHPHTFSLPSFSHLLIGFGGPAGLEDCCKRDPGMEGHDVTEFCHYYLNTCPAQGSRTIRTEEAMWVSLSYFHAAIEASRI